jgi:protein-tyrosine phosphatase
VIDLHSHLLPGVDDGARDVAESTETLQQLAAQGYAAIVLTPHLLASRSRDGLPARFDDAFAKLRPTAPDGVELHRGVELMLDVPMPTLVTPEVFTLAGSRYLLVEFPLMVLPQTATSLIAQVRAQDLTPVVAHPERYGACSVPVVRAWRAAGAAIQVDATTLTSGSRRGVRARALLEHGLADVLAADNHGDTRSLLTAVEYLRAFRAGSAIKMLTESNPRAVIEGKELEPVEPVRFVASWLDRVRWWVRNRGDASKRRRRAG